MAAWSWVSASTALAQSDDPEPLRVEVDAPPPCTDGARFFAEVTSRTSRARAAKPGERARTIRVRVTPEGPRTSGELVILDDAGVASTPRSVRGATCDDVVSALGLIVALAVDPRARTEPLPRPAPPGPASPSTSASPSPPASASPSPPASASPSPPPASASPSPPASASPSPPASAPPSASASPSPSASASPSPRAPAPAPASSPTRLRLGAAASATAASTSELVLGADVGFDITWLGTALAPALRLGAARTFGARAHAEGGSAALVFTTAFVDGCLGRLASGRLEARPCARVGGGVVDAEGRGVAVSTASTRPWIYGGVGGRGSVRVLDFLAVELQLRGIVPFVRDRFFVEPGATIFEPPVAAIEGSLGLFATFP